MYYEERIIDGKMYWRSAPDGQWVELTNAQLTKKLQESTRQESAEMYENAPWWANPNLPPSKVTC